MRTRNHGGDGSSKEMAIVIEAANILVGTDAEYAHIGASCGLQGRDWSLLKQSTFHSKGRTYDQIEVRLSDGRQKTFYFDITEIMG